MKSYIFILLACFTLIACEDAPTQTIEAPALTIQKQSVVFIAGFDEDDNTFYTNAKVHFSQQNIAIVEDLYTLEAIILWLNTNADDKIYDKIHIVSHSNAWRGMSVRTREDGQRTTSISLQDVTLPKPNKSITENTKIIFHSCGLGANKELMKSLKSVFSSDVTPNLFASEYFNVFGGKYASHYLAQPFYVFYPTANSPGNEALSKEIAHKYPSASLNWLTALSTREETTSGAVYSYRFNIPVEWDFTFENASDIPNLEDADAIMDFILMNDELSLELFELGIPMEKFRWDFKIDNNHLTIKGKTTVLTVLMPLMNTYDPIEYTTPEIMHPRLYTKM